MLLFVVVKIQKKNDILKISKFYQFYFFCIFNVLQFVALGAALDNCLCFSFARRVTCQKSILPTDSITIVDVRL